MRVSPRELRGIRAEGLVTRFAILGPVAFVSVEVPAAGSSGTGLERPTENAAWGIVLNGSVSLHGPLEQELPRGAAFHIPAGPPPHSFSAPGRAVIAGFAPLEREIDTSDEGMRALGFEPLHRLPPAQPLPTSIAPVTGGAKFRAPGSIDVETARMGDWVFTRSTYGPLSGYASGWCDMAHWGLVLSGDLALRFEKTVELLTAGDVFYCPSGPPGHQFQIADAATTIDYTPAADLFGPGRKAEWRAAAARRLVESEPDARVAWTSRAVTPADGAGGGRGGADRSTAAPLVPDHLDVAREPAPVRGVDSSVSSRHSVQWVRRGILRPIGARVG